MSEKRCGTSGEERFVMTRQSAAAMMLMSRGCLQPVAAFGVSEQIAELREQLSNLEDEVSQYEGTYIAPTELEAVTYSVKRPGRIIETSEGRVR